MASSFPPSQKGTPSLSDVKRATRPDPFFHASGAASSWSEQERVSFQEVPTPPLWAKPPNSSPRRSGTVSRKRKGFFWGGLVLCFLVAGYFLIQKGLTLKEESLEKGGKGYEYIMQAVTSLKDKQYVEAANAFDRASQSFGGASEQLSFFGDFLIDTTRFVPGLSRAASGKYALEAGKHFALAGKSLSELAAGISISREAYAQGEKISLIDFFHQARDPLREARLSLERAERALEKVSIDDIPEDKREKFLSARTTLPVLLGLFQSFEKNDVLLEELLGGNGPRTYLFLLQNNHEMRATGGFIGSYALVDINQGVIRRFFVDGIFNPDGQLKENIVPPKPIQKISAGWSLHDSNWFPDFPTSAEKAIFFYEKTGGSTVDGVIALTPTVMQKLLSVIGPITLPQYGLTIDADNFIPVVQEQVEVKYDKEQNEPKKILVDLSRALLEKVFALQDRTTLRRIAEAFTDGLNQKHVLMYMRHPETEQLIDEVGWSGRLLHTPKDYLSVIHSNINGYKTDGVIDERIRHQAKIEADGSIIDTVTITRTHHGGDTPYEWWNKVNADYLRVYVPKGSELIASSGTTWEFPEAPLDYERLGFKKDTDVVREEAGMTIDQKSGVRVSTDADKTVFGAWVYVSPKESVTVEYRYRLPFRIDMEALGRDEVSAYSVLFQKQAGSPGSKLSSKVIVPETTKVIWQTEPNLIPYGRELRRETDLKTDVFQGMVLGRE
ncbi:MAG: DUF4012 domain-containing protein [Candidatus Moraniibacteriota bacterium]